MESLLIIAAASIVVGLLVGMLSGLLGIGGGTILVPVFKLGFGLPAIVSTATSMFTIIPTSISGAITHIRNRTCIPKLGVVAGIGGAVTSPLGVFLASVSPDWAIMVAAALVIAYSATTIFRKALQLQRAQRENLPATVTSPASDAAAVPPEPSLAEITASLTGKTMGKGAMIGVCAGIFSGYVGVGGGFIMVPLFMQLIGTPMKLTSGTSLIAVMILAIPGTITQALMGNVNWIAGVFVALGAIPGAIIGSKLIERVPELQLRYIFSGFLIIASIMLIADQVLGV